MDHHSLMVDHMPSARRVTVFDDLPVSIISREIFPRLPSRDVLRCGAVSKSWRGAATAKACLLDHHSRQPSLPLVVFRDEAIVMIRAVDALDIRQAPAVRRPVLRFNDCHHNQTFRIQASCDGLLLLSQDIRFSIINPVTRQWLALPRLAGADGQIAGMYRNPQPGSEDEYRVLFWRRENEVASNAAGYYVLTVGSSQKPKYLGPPAASAGILAWRAPLLFKRCLHWNQYSSHGSVSSGILVFDTLEESFRNISYPKSARGSLVLLEVEGMLGLRCLDSHERVMKIWVLRDSERSEVWSVKCQIKLPMVEYWRHTLMSDKGDMLVYYASPWLHQLHYDDNGDLLEDIQFETRDLNITGLWFKESLVRHTFLPKRSGRRAKQARFFRTL